MSHKLITKLKSSALFKDSFWALTGNVLGKGLALLASIVIARLLGKDMFGAYGLVRTTLLTIAIFSTFGLGYTSTKFIAEYITNSPSKISSLISRITQLSLIVGLIFSVAIYCFSDQISVLLNIEELSDSIRYLAIIILFNSLTTTQIGILAGFKKFKATARINCINGIIVFVLSSILSYFYQLEGALLALLISQVFNCLQNYVEVRKSITSIGVQVKAKINVKDILKFSTPIALQEMVPSILSVTIPVLLVKFSNIGEIGLYNAAAQWSSVILFIPGALKNVIFSHLSSESDNPEKQKGILNRILLINFVATFIPFVIVWLLSGFIIHFYGSTFTGLKAVLNISVFTTIFSCLYGSLQRYFMINKKGWLVFIVEVISGIVTVAIFIALAANNENGALNISIAKVSVAILIFVFYLYLYRHNIKSDTKLL